MDLVGIINIINIHYINDIYKKTIINKFKTFLMDYTYRFNIFIINFINLYFNINYYFLILFLLKTKLFKKKKKK